jgi:NAD(P)H-dependent FMN reductase
VINAELPSIEGSSALFSVLLISGSTRGASANSALLRTAPWCVPAGVRTVSFDRIATLPHVNADLNVAPLPDAVGQLRTAIEGCDAVLFCTPEYAGTLPGSLKNLLDWCVGGTCLTDKSVTWINVAADPRRSGGAGATMATVLGYLQARVVEQACVHIPVERTDVGKDGRIASQATRAAITAVLADLVASSDTKAP